MRRIRLRTTTRLSFLFRQMNKFVNRFSQYLTLSVFLICWYVAAAGGTALSKFIVDHFHSPVLLSQCHLMASAMGDIIVMSLNRSKLPRFDRKLLKLASPVALGMVCCKTLTYVSYGFVTPALTQTVKASSPVFTILLMVLDGHRPTMRLFLPLVPICAGVAIAALTEQYFHLFGFYIALVSAFAQVWQTVKTKQCFAKMPDGPDPILFHFYCSLIGFIMQAPYVILTELNDVIQGVENSNQAKGVFSLHWFALSVVLGYASNIFSLMFLSQVDVLSHSVANTIKRLVIIATSIFFFDLPVTTMNLSGISLALTGLFWYSYENQLQKMSKRGPKINTDSDSERSTVEERVLDETVQIHIQPDHSVRLVKSHASTSPDSSTGDTFVEPAANGTLNVHVHNHITNINVAGPEQPGGPAGVATSFIMTSLSKHLVTPKKLRKSFSEVMLSRPTTPQHSPLPPDQDESAETIHQRGLNGAGPSHRHIAKPALPQLVEATA
eukprot:g83363.t1